MRCVAKPDMMYISGVEGGQGSQGIVTHSSGPPEWEGSKKIVRHWLRGVQSWPHPQDVFTIFTCPLVGASRRTPNTKQDAQTACAPPLTHKAVLVSRFFPPPFDPSSSVKMTIDTVLPTSRHPVHDCSTSDLSLDTHHESENEPGLEADSFCGPIDSPFNTYYLGQDPHRPDALAGSIDWQTITTRTPGVNSPSFQEVLGGTGAFHAVSAAYSTYSVSLRTPALSPRFYTAS